MLGGRAFRGEAAPVTRSLLAAFCLCTLARCQVASSPDRVYAFDPTVVHSPVTIFAPDAPIPDEAKQRQLLGLCALTLVVDRRGFPQNPKIVRCTDSIFAENSLNTVSKYRFAPATTVSDNKAVPFRMHIEISYRFGAGDGLIPMPHPRFRIAFLMPSRPSLGPDNGGIYSLSHAFDPPNSFPKIQRFANGDFGHAAFSLEDGAGCVVALTINEAGHPTDAQVSKCDDPSLENPILRALWKSQFSPAALNGKPVPVRVYVHLVCEGFEPSSQP